MNIQSFLKPTTSLLLIVACSFALSGCGGGSEDGWKTINPPGTQCTFELPEPVENPSREGYKLYQTTFGGQPGSDPAKAKTIQVGIFPRTGPVGSPEAEAEILNQFEKESIPQFQNKLVEQGFSPTLEFLGDLAVKDGLGQEIKILANGPFVTMLYYITPRGMYMIKIDNADDTDPVIKRFMDSFEP